MELGAVRARIARAAARAGREASDVGIVAVTKTHPLAAVQEATEKQDAWRGDAIRWHLIGHLQRNKAKAAVGRFALIHSVDSIRLADALEVAAAARGLTQDVLVQVNVAREPQKDGALPEDAEALVRHVQGRPHLLLKGLMTIAPLTDDQSVIRETFRGLRMMNQWQLPVLSMGMSHDFEIAVEEGATLLRLGTILFGERTP